MGKATVRKIAVSAKPVSVVKPRAIKAEAKPAPVQVPAPSVILKPARERKNNRVEHGFASLYTGDSPGLNKRKSTTVLDLSLFNTKPDYVLSERSELVAETIKKEYGPKPFPRANLDAGVLKHLLLKGFVERVSGDGGENTILRFTKAGMAYHRKA